MPVPRTTQSAGFSASVHGMRSSVCTRRQRPPSSAPPPVSVMPVLVDVRGELRGRALQDRVDGLDDGGCHLLDRLGDLRRLDVRRARQPGQDGAAVTSMAPMGGSGGDDRQLHLDALGRALADEEVVVAPHVLDDGLVHLVAGDGHALLDHGAAHGDDGDVRRAAADVHDHAPARLGHRGAPAPIAAATGSSMSLVSMDPASAVASTTERRSTSVTPAGTQTTTRGRAKLNRPMTRRR